jgi:hypothetical protein
MTVQRCGWAGIKNGELLAFAEKEFEVFVTIDRKLSTEQELTKFGIAVLRNAGIPFVCVSVVVCGLTGEFSSRRFQ